MGKTIIILQTNVIIVQTFTIISQAIVISVQKFELLWGKYLRVKRERAGDGVDDLF